MSSERQGWEDRHLGRVRQDPGMPGSQFLCEHLRDLPPGRALDVACGGGRNALLLAEHGFVVDAVDFAFAALDHLRNEARRRRLHVHAIQADLERFPVSRDTYAVILNIRYLERSLWPELKDGLRAGGVLVFETFLRDQERVGHPRNPRFLLERGELSRGFSDLDILLYEEGFFETEGEPAFLARMLARRPAR
jgi:tellurite methyltransferase